MPIDPARMNNIEDELVLLDGRPVTPSTVNGKWLKGVGGVPVWSDITTADITDRATAGGVATLGSTGQLTAAQRLSVGPNPPGSPIDGDLWATPCPTGGIWLFRYNAAGGTYKWDFVGGPPVYQMVDASQNTNSTTAADLATVGPQITLPRLGEYWTQASAMAIQTGTAQSANVGIQSQTGILSACMLSGAGNGWVNSCAGSCFYVNTTANFVAKLQYYSSGGQTVNFQMRRLWAWPIRVS